MFESNRYQVREKTLSKGDQHKVYEEDDLILYSRIEDKDLREDVVFVDQDDNTRLVVTTNPKLDVPVSYSIIDSEKDEVVGGLRREWGSLRHRWKLIAGDNSIVGTIKEDHLSLSLIRRFITTVLPFRYDMVDEDGEHLADIDGEFNMRDVYNVNIHSDLDPRLVLAAALVMDFIETK
ncbi:MAG: hypothetical protein ABEJ87_00725 [Candidatus Nanohalobium sp.]